MDQLTPPSSQESQKPKQQPSISESSSAFFNPPTQPHPLNSQRLASTVLVNLSDDDNDDGNEQLTRHNAMSTIR